MPLSSRDWGNSDEGIDVSHNLNSLFSSLLWASFSNIISSYGMNEWATWQFYNRIQRPSLAPFWISRAAFSPYPWPNDSGTNFCEKLSLSARFCISCRGSAPVERMKMSGVRLSLSLNKLSRLKTGGSRYYFPNSCTTSSCANLMNLSGLMSFTTINLWKRLKLSGSLTGNSRSWGLLCQ